MPPSRRRLPLSDPAPVPAAAGGTPGTGAVDRRGRPLRELRISVTDRCNFRCGYCMPREAFRGRHAFLPKREILTFEEITRVARAFVELGVRKLRLTGGEPLLRAELPILVEMLSRLPGVDLALTTNGAFLAERAARLAGAGLRRCTVSLDAIDPDVFRRTSDSSVPVSSVLAGLEAARAAGLHPLKVNCVVRRGVNEDQIVPLARRFLGTGVVVRFIEFMDVGTTNGWSLAEVVPEREIVERIDAELPLEPASEQRQGEVARRYRYRDGAGEIGVIASVTRPFCGTCTRARLSADGHVYTCLFAARGTDLRPALRGGGGASLERVLTSLWQAREDRYSELRSGAAPEPRIEMSYIGG